MSAGATPIALRKATELASASELARKLLPFMLVFSSVIPPTSLGMSASRAGSASAAAAADADGSVPDGVAAAGEGELRGDAVEHATRPMATSPSRPPRQAAIRVMPADCGPMATRTPTRRSVAPDRMWLRKVLQRLGGNLRIVGEDD